MHSILAILGPHIDEVEYYELSEPQLHGPATGDICNYVTVTKEIYELAFISNNMNK